MRLVEVVKLNQSERCGLLPIVPTSSGLPDAKQDEKEARGLTSVLPNTKASCDESWRQSEFRG